MKKLLLATAALLAMSAAASADMAVRLQEGIVTQDFFSAPGSSSFTASNVPFQDFLIANISGSSSPTTQAPVLLSTNNLDVQNVTGSHILQVFITGNNLTDPTGLLQAFSNFTSVTLSNGWVTTLQSLVDTANGNFTGTEINHITFTGDAVGSAFASNLSNTVNFGAGPFSLTAHYTIATDGFGQANSGISIAAVPGPIVGAGLPGLLAMLGFGGFSFWKRRTAVG